MGWFPYGTEGRTMSKPPSPARRDGLLSGAPKNTGEDANRRRMLDVAVVLGDDADHRLILVEGRDEARPVRRIGGLLRGVDHEAWNIGDDEFVHVNEIDLGGIAADAQILGDRLRPGEGNATECAAVHLGPEQEPADAVALIIEEVLRALRHEPMRIGH